MSNSVNSEQIKTLRDKTGAGIMDCKKALLETEGDIESAVDWLRKKGISENAGASFTSCAVSFSRDFSTSSPARIFSAKW